MAFMHGFGAPLLLVGTVLAILGYLTFFRSVPAHAALPSDPGRPQDRLSLFLLLAILAIGAALRLSNLEARGLMHPEIYIPGMDLPAKISRPFPRYGWFETAAWHFHFEPHPFGYFLAMLGWTKLFGASVESIRMPAAILGAASIPLIYRIGELTYGRRAGLVAAALLALQGFHVLWSQTARMYAPGAFLALLATLLLLELCRRERPSRLLGAAYVASLVACAMTIEFCWPFLFTHILWAALRQRKAAERIAYVSVLQAVAAAIAAPMLSHSVMTGRNDATPPPTLSFLEHYFSFGFAFEHGAYSEPWVGGLPPALYPAALVFSLVLMGFGLSARSIEGAPAARAPRPWIWPLLVVALGSCLTMLGMMTLSFDRRKAMTVISVLPWLTILLPLIAAEVRPLMARLLPALDRRLDAEPRLTALVPLLAILSPLVVFLISFKVSLTAERAFLIFVPYLLLLIAAGVDRIAARKAVGGAVVAALLATFAASYVMLSKQPISPRDYRGLAAAMTAQMKPDDMIFVRSEDWKSTPIFLYLPHGQLVASDYAARAGTTPAARIWVPLFEDKPDKPLADALAGYHVVTRVTALRAAADLYAR